MPPCLNHPPVEAVAPCALCGQPFCATCLVELAGQWNCGRCRDYRLAQMQGYQAPPQPAGPPTLADQIIPTKNPKALIGYYVGVFGLAPCLGNLLGPVAIVLGILGLKARAANPNLPGKAHAITAIVLGSLEVLVYWGGIVLLITTGHWN